MFAIEPRTGPRARERVVAELRPEPRRAGLAARARGSALVNRATQGLYPPGSSIKPVIAALALESGRVQRARRQFYDPGYFVEYGRKIMNDSGERFFGRFDLTDRAHAFDQQRLREARHSTLRRPRALPGAHRRAPAPRLLLDPAARLPDRPAGGLRHGAPGHAHAALAERADRPGAHGHRPGQSRRHADADGDGRRGDRERRRRDAADARRPRALAQRRAALRAPQPAAEPRVQRADGRRRDGDDEARRRRAAPARLRRSRACRSPARPARRRPARNGQLDAWFIAFAPAEEPQVAVAVVVERTRSVRRRRPPRRSPAR